MSFTVFIDAIRVLLFPALMAYAASSDLLTMKISNRVSLVLVAGFAALAPLMGLGLHDIAVQHVGAGVLVLALGITCYSFGWMGGGDVKLASATALWFGFGFLLDYLLIASLIGGALTLLILKFRALPLPHFLERQYWAVRLHRPDTGVPYGIALALSAMLVYPSTVWMAG